MYINRSCSSYAALAEYGMYPVINLGLRWRSIQATNYIRQAIFVKFVGSHEQYDLIDAETYDGYISS